MLYLNEIFPLTKVTMNEIILPIFLAVLSGSALTALVTYALGKKKQPLDALSAKTDAASSLVASSLSIVSKLEEKVKQLEDKDADKEIRLEKMELETRTQANLIQRLTARIELWVTWSEGLRINWPLIRLNEEPPDPPKITEEEHQI